MSRITSPVSTDPPWLSMYPGTPAWQHQAAGLLLLTVLSFVLAFLPLASLYHLHRKRKRRYRDDATLRRHFRSSDANVRQEISETIVTGTIAVPSSVLRLFRSFDAGTLLALFFLILLPQLRSTFEHFVQLHVTQTVSRKILPGENVLRNISAFQSAQNPDDLPEYSERRSAVPGQESGVGSPSATSQTTAEEFENISAALLSRFNSPIPLVELVLCLAFFALHFLEEFIQICFRYRKYFWACNSSVLYSSSRDQCPLTALDYRISKTKRFLIDCSRKTSSSIEQQQHHHRHQRQQSPTPNYQSASAGRPPKIGPFNTRPAHHYQVSTPTFEGAEQHNVNDPELIDIDDVPLSGSPTASLPPPLPLSSSSPNHRLESIAEVNNENDNEHDSTGDRQANDKSAAIRRKNSSGQNSSQDSLISESSSIHLPSYYWDTGQRLNKQQSFVDDDDDDDENVRRSANHDANAVNCDDEHSNDVIIRSITGDAQHHHHHHHRHHREHCHHRTAQCQNSLICGDNCVQQCVQNAAASAAASLALLHQCCDHQHSFVAAHQPPYAHNHHQQTPLSSGDYSLNSTICWQCHAQQVLETFCRQNQHQLQSIQQNAHPQQPPTIFTKIFLPFTTVATSTPAIYLCEGALIALQPNLSLFWLSLAIVVLHKTILGLSVTLELYEKTTGRQKHWPNSTSALYTLLPLSGFLLVCLLNGYFVLKDQLPGETGASFTVLSLAGSVHNITTSTTSVPAPSANLQRLLIVKIIILALCSGACLHVVLLVVQRSWNAFQSSEPRIRVNKAPSCTNTAARDCRRNGSLNSAESASTGRRPIIQGMPGYEDYEDDGSNVNDLELITDPPRFSIVHHFTMYTGFIVVLLAVAFFNITSKTAQKS